MLNLLILIGFLSVVLYHGTVLGVSQVWRGFQLNINNYKSFPHQHVLHEDTVISNLSMTVQRPVMGGKDVFSVSDDVNNATDDPENQENLSEFTQLSTDDDLEKQKPDITLLSSVVSEQESSPSNWKGRTNQRETLIRGDLNNKEKLRKEHINGLHQSKNSYTVKLRTPPSTPNTSYKRKNKLFDKVNSQKVLWAVRELCCSVFLRQIRNNKETRIVSNEFVPNTQHVVTELSNNESTRQNEAHETSEEKDVISNVLGFQKPKNSKEGESSNNEKSLISTQPATHKRLHLVKHHIRYNCRKGNGNHKLSKKFNRKSIVKRDNLDEHLNRNRIKPQDVYKRYPMRNLFRKKFHHGILWLKNKNAFRYSPWKSRPVYISKNDVRNVT